MNNYPILHNIARQIRDMNTLLSFMLVNKKCHKVTKYVIETSPTLFVPYIEYEEDAIPYNVLAFSSLKDLFTELHAREINMNKYRTNYSGPCSDCLREPFIYVRCGCFDTFFRGIKMIKCINVPLPSVNLQFGWRPSIQPSDMEHDGYRGFRMSTWLYLDYDDTLDTIKCNTNNSIPTPFLTKTNTTTNYESMEYLYKGHPMMPIVTKLGLKQSQEYYGKYYPATTETIERFHTFESTRPTSKYMSQNNIYITFDSITVPYPNGWRQKMYFNTI